MKKTSLVAIFILLVFLLIIILLDFWQKSEIAVISYQPISDSIAVNDKLVLQFNTDVNPNNVLQKIHIEPILEYDWNYDKENERLILKPKKDLEYNTTYTVTLNKGIKNGIKKASSQNTTWSFTTKKRMPIKITLLGDILLYQLEAELAKGNPDYAYSKLNKEIINPNNYIIGNLENPISARGTEIKQKNYRFRAKPDTVKILTTGNIKAVSLANNHALDYGPQALLDTVNICENAGITCFGHNQTNNDSKYVIVNYKNYKIGLLSYVDINTIPTVYKDLWQGKNNNIAVNYISDNIIDDVKAVKKECDILIVALHWGIERSKQATNRQVELAHKLIENGVDIITGHHPHSIQGIEKYKNGIICYSLGNFIFPPYNRRRTYVPVIEISKDGILNTTIYPLKPINGVPCSMNEQQTSMFYNEIKKLSSTFNTEFILKKEIITIK